MSDLQLYLSTKAGSDLTIDGLELQVWSLTKSVITAAEAQQVAASESEEESIVVTTLYLEPEGIVRISRFAHEHCVLVDFEVFGPDWEATIAAMRGIQDSWEDEDVHLIVGEAYPDTKVLVTSNSLIASGRLYAPYLPEPPRPVPVLAKLSRRDHPNQMELPLFV
ncbi:hypothetical protein [Tomitella biformata]|uniref:hypothetical protein n=1 Tax=Tomitella biformata TaxID=630403 RepID=UPI0004645DE1|nr:hypothetical protein [Tomitella biformata]